jgi:hypothetical protein
MPLSARQAENMLQGTGSCQLSAPAPATASAPASARRDETRRDGTGREVLARRAMFVSSFQSLASRDVSNRPALPAICLHHQTTHPPARTKTGPGPRGPRGEDCGGRAGSADLVIDETNQATGKRVFPRPSGCCRDEFPTPTPDSSSSPTPKRLRAQRSSHCTARGAQNEGMGEPQIAAYGEFCRSDGSLK